MLPLFRFAGTAYALTTATLFVLPAHAQTKQSSKQPVRTALTGTYRGKLVITPSASLTLVFRFGGSVDKPTATLDVPEQGAKGIPVAETTIKGGAVTLRLPNIGASFAGTRGKDGQTISGTFSQGGKSLPLTLTRSEESSAVLSRPQTPKPPFPYRVVEVSYTNPDAAGVTLAGTLNIPQGAGPFPVALFITGSGPQDRDETIMGHKPFAVIADHLARRGIASLRVDDRGVGKSTGGVTAEVTSVDFASDVRAGVAYLKTRSDIDARRIGLIGHSEGGFIAPMVAANNPEIAFVVLLAGTGVPGKEVILEQQKAAIKAMGFPEAVIRENLRISEAILKIIETEKDPAAARQKMTAFIAKAVAAAPAAQRPAAIRQLQNAYLPWCEPWFFYFLRTDPAPVLQSVTCPVLALNGTLDLQVSAKQNLAPLEAALKKGNNKDVTVRELPGLNHLFQHAKTGAPLEYGTITETFAPEALTMIGDWIAARTKAATP